MGVEMCQMCFGTLLRTRFRPGKTAGTANNTQDGRDTPRKTTKQQTGRRQPPAGPLLSLLRFLIKTPEQNIPTKSHNFAEFLKMFLLGLLCPFCVLFLVFERFLAQNRSKMT